MRNLLIMLCASMFISHSIEAQNDLPKCMQNKKWIKICEYNNQYFRLAREVVFATYIDSVEYIGSGGSSFGDRWQAKEIEDTKNGLKLYNDKVANQFFEFSWIDKDRRIGRWEKSYNTDDYCDDYDFLVVDSAYLDELELLLIDVTNIADIDEYVNIMYRIDYSLNRITVDYDRDGIEDTIIAFKEWAFDDEVNQEYRNYQVLFFQGKRDGTFSHQHTIQKVIQKPGKLVAVSAKKNTCQLFISNVIDEKNYDPFVEGLETELSDFEEIRSINETYQYNRNKKEWILKSTKEKIIKR